MKKTLISYLLTFVFLISSAYSLDIPAKHELDKREYRRFVLDNQLKVLLVSDPEMNTSAAAMDIQVGSLSDPRNRQGLAHFLEHMLFLGTRKFPDVDEYGKYLKSRGGYSNAFTAGDHTNYHFQVHHDAFEGALDRFSQFFIAPLFNPDYTDKEINAVNNEHMKNLQNDMWRKYNLMNTLYRKDHPANHFSTGNAKTLEGVDSAEFKEFYQQYYSSNRMGLVLASKKSLDWMESMVRKYFTEVKNHDLEKIKFPTDYLPEKKTFRLVKVKPIKDIRTLEIDFPLPGTLEYYASKPTQLIGHLLGHEGKGSLLSLLKAEGLATGLSAGGYSATADYGSLSINVSLSEKGLEEYARVVKFCFSYINMMKANGYVKQAFEESKTMAKLNEVYANRGEGTGLAADLAGNLNRYPLEVAERVSFIFEKENPEAYQKILSYLRPDNMICVLTGKNLETDKKESIYGTEYSFSENEDFYKELLKVTEHPQLSMPAANPFLPKNANSLSERPVQILNYPGVDLWYSQDTQFKRPKVSLLYHLRLSKAKTSLRFSTMLDIYSAVVREQLNELAYPASQAGLHYSVSADLAGINIIVSGYNDSAPILLKEISKELLNIHIDEVRFNNIKDRMIRGWRNFEKDAAYKIIRMVSRQFHREHVFPYAIKANELENITLIDL
ncbi:MAG: insulinase family protein, partial [Planctomycetes bacterium]|nr:insulinase family protein [Planctomycetota bacterium]